MKRITAILAALLLTVAASAQKNHFRIGLGGYPWIPALFTADFGHDWYYSVPASLGNIYMDREGSSFTTGNIYGEYAWDLKKWFTASVSASTDIIWTNGHDSVTDRRTYTDVNALVHIMGKAKFNWVSGETVKLYSAISLGIITGYADEIVGLPGIQINPVGIEIGKKVFFFCETGIGTTYIGGMAGIGYRF